MSIRLESSAAPPVLLDNQGRFRVTDLAAGAARLVVAYNGSEFQQDLELPADPAPLSGIAIDVCRPQR